MQRLPSYESHVVKSKRQDLVDAWQASSIMLHSNNILINLFASAIGDALNKKWIRGKNLFFMESV